MEHEPTLVDRELGLRVREAMTSAGLVMETLAKRSGYTTSRVSRQLSGRQAMSTVDVATLLTLCGWTLDRQEPLWQLCRDGGTRNVVWVEPNRVCASFRAHTRHLTRLTQVASTVLPWTVQTPDYAHAVARAAGVPISVTAEWATLRGAVQRWWANSDMASAAIFVHEHALRMIVGCRSVMVKQIEELLRLAELPGLSLRLIPAEAGVCAVTNGGFTLLEYDRWRPLVFQEHGGAGIFASTPDAIAAAERATARLTAIAHPSDVSCTLLREIMRESSGPAGVPRCP